MTNEVETLNQPFQREDSGKENRQTEREIGERSLQIVVVMKRGT